MNARPPDVLLLCFAHAGGSAQLFRGWQALLPEGVQVHAVELPGRGRRGREPLQHDYTAMVDALADELAVEIAARQHRDEPLHYAAFGHSAGASFAFGVCARLAERLRRPPLHCFFAAGLPPHLPRRARSAMSDAALLAEIRALSGTRPEVLEHPELMAFFLPILRADFAAYEGAVADRTRQLDCDFTLLAAARDDIAPQEVWAWQRHTSREARTVSLAGDHFSVLQSAALIDEIKHQLGEEILS